MSIEMGTAERITTGTIRIAADASAPPGCVRAAAVAHRFNVPKVRSEVRARS